MISAATPAQAKEELYKWYDVKAIATPVDPMLVANGATRTLADFRGQVVVLNIWATWCTPCLKELPTLDKLEEKYMSEGLVVLPLSVDTLPYEQLRGFMKKLKLELPHLAQDNSGAFNKALVGRGLPITYLIDRTGALRYRFEGGTDWLSAENQEKISALLREPESR